MCWPLRSTHILLRTDNRTDLRSQHQSLPQSSVTVIYIGLRSRPQTSPRSLLTTNSKKSRPMLLSSSRFHCILPTSANLGSSFRLFLIPVAYSLPQQLFASASVLPTLPSVATNVDNFRRTLASVLRLLRSRTLNLSNSHHSLPLSPH